MFRVIALLLAFSSAAFAEIVTTTDGRQIELKPDGTYIISNDTQNDPSEYLESNEPFLMPHTSEYQQESIRFMPIFRNNSDQTIVGTKFRAEFQNAFGDTVLTFEGETSERVPPKTNSSNKVFYVLEDNPFIGGESYDKIMPLVRGKTIKTRVVFTAIALEDGSVVRFEPVD